MNIIDYFLIASSLSLTACSWVGVECQPPALIAGELAFIQAPDDERQRWQFDGIDTFGSADVEPQYSKDLQVGLMSERLQDPSCQSDENIELTLGSGWTIMPIPTSRCEVESGRVEHVAAINSQ